VQCCAVMCSVHVVHVVQSAKHFMPKIRAGKRFNPWAALGSGRVENRVEQSGAEWRID
jgi:hypothetical protein